MSEMISNPMRQIHELLDGLFIAEISNPFLQTHFILEARGTLGTTFGALNDMMFAITWFFFRYIWGFPYAFHNFECYRGSTFIYTLASVFIFLSTIWSIDLLVGLRDKVKGMCGAKQPMVVRLYDRFVNKLLTERSFQALYYGTALASITIIPLCMRLKALYWSDTSL